MRDGAVDRRFGKVDVYIDGEVVVWNTEGQIIPEFSGRWEALAEAIAHAMPLGMQVQHHNFVRGSVEEIAQACQDLAAAFAQRLANDVGPAIGFAVIVFPKEQDPAHGGAMPGAWTANVEPEKVIGHLRTILARHDDQHEELLAGAAPKQ